MVHITHPDLPDSHQVVPESVFETVLEARGWTRTTSPEEDARAVQAAIVEQQANQVLDQTIDEVLGDVAGDPIRAEAALAAERDGKNRKTLITELQRILDQGD